MPASGGHNNRVDIGGAVTNSAIAVGSGAKAQVVSAAAASMERRGLEELAARLRTLEQALAVDEQRLGDASDTVRERTAAMAEELSKPSPRKSVVALLLQGIAEHSRSAASVLNAVQGLLEAVHRLL